MSDDRGYSQCQQGLKLELVEAQPSGCWAKGFPGGFILKLPTAAAKQHGGTKASSVGNIPRGSIPGPLLCSFKSRDSGSVRFCHGWGFLKSWGPWPVMGSSSFCTHECPEFCQEQERSEQRPSPLSSQDHRQQCLLSEEQGSFLKALLRFNSHDICKLFKGRN